LSECKPNLRCGALACSDDRNCPPNSSCSNALCALRACAEDSECEGYCVNGFCYDSLGVCHTQYAVP
jgi:hypothetical protein